MTTAPTYAEALALLLDATLLILREELADELSATAEALEITLQPPGEAQIKAGNMRALTDQLPAIDVYIISSRIEPGDALMRGDTLSSRIDVVLYVGERGLGSASTVDYARGIYAYTMAIAGLLVRRLPSTCVTGGTGIYDVTMEEWTWDTRIARDVWRAEAPVSLRVSQAVRPDRPIPEVPS